jgi:hypothetical protein
LLEAQFKQEKARLLNTLLNGLISSPEIWLIFGDWREFQVAVAKGEDPVFWDSNEEYKSFSFNTHFKDLVSDINGLKFQYHIVQRSFE